mmetsp:Transcript_31937/g.56357  ORF Transcript_31937/g.56357 Transcript_31937/m.56357 type:complete len:217 (+) Transcript_31937:654-1304(+)
MSSAFLPTAVNKHNSRHIVPTQHVKVYLFRLHQHRHQVDCDPFLQFGYLEDAGEGDRCQTGSIRSVHLYRWLIRGHLHTNLASRFGNCEGALLHVVVSQFLPHLYILALGIVRLQDERRLPDLVQVLFVLYAVEERSKHSFDPPFVDIPFAWSVAVAQLPVLPKEDERWEVAAHVSDTNLLHVFVPAVTLYCEKLRWDWLSLFSSKFLSYLSCGSI